MMFKTIELFLFPKAVASAVSRLALILTLGSFLASCGGGGSSGAPPPAPPTFSIGGSITGLLGNGVTLVDTNASSVFVQKDGSFILPNALANGTSYSVRVSVQPAQPSQTCTVANGTGTMEDAPVTNVVVTCVTNSYAVGGVASGVAGLSVALQLNGGEALNLAADGPFAFPNSLLSGTAYAVTIASQPKDFLCSVQNGTGTVTGSDKSNIAVNCAVDQTSITVVFSLVHASDIAWEPHANLLYLSMSSISPVAPNGIAAFDPVTGAVASSGFLGSEPASVSPTDDGTSLYVGFSGSQVAMRLALPSMSPNLQISTVDFDTYQNGGPYAASPMFPLQVAAAPGTSQTFGLLSVFTQGLSGAGSVLVYDSGVSRWDMGPGGSNAPAANRFAWGADTTTLHSMLRSDPGIGPMYLRYGVSATQAQIFTQVSGLPLLDNGLSFAGGLVYSDSGKSINPVLGTITETYIPDATDFASRVIAPDIAANRVFTATSDLYGNITLQSFFVAGVNAIATVPISAPKGNVQKMIRWGIDGLALLLKGGGLVIINGPFVAPGGTAVVGKVAGSDNYPVAGFMPAQVLASVSANDIAADIKHAKVFASIPASAAVHPKSIATLDPMSGAVLGYTDLTINPGVLAVSADGSYLYIAASDDAIVQRWLLPQMTFDISIALGSAPEAADDIVVAPGAPRTIAVAQQNPAFTPSTGPIQVFDNAVARPAPSIPFQGDWIEWGVGGTNLYSFENQSTGFAMRGYATTPTGATLTNATTECLSANPQFPFPFYTTFKVAGNIVYGDTGVVWNPATRAIIGIFAVSAPAPVAVDIPHQRVYFAVGQLIEAFDSLHYTPVFNASVRTDYSTTRFIETGPGSFAMRTSAGEVILLNDPQLKQ